MENKEDDIEHLFQDRFANDEVPISPRVWQNIKQTLPEEKDSRGFMFSANSVLWSIAGILMLSAVVVYFIFLTPENKSTSPSAEKTSEYSTTIASENDRTHNKTVKDSVSDSPFRTYSDAKTNQSSNQNDNSGDITSDRHQTLQSENETPALKNHVSNKEHSSMPTLSNSKVVNINNKNRNSPPPSNKSIALRKPVNKKTKHAILASQTNQNSQTQKNERTKKGKTKTTPDGIVSNRSSDSFDEIYQPKDDITGKPVSPALASVKTKIRKEHTIGQTLKDKKTILNNRSSLTTAYNMRHASLAFNKTIPAKSNTYDSVVPPENYAYNLLSQSSVLHSDSSTISNLPFTSSTISHSQDSLKHVIDDQNQKAELTTSKDLKFKNSLGADSSALNNASDKKGYLNKQKPLMPSTDNNNSGTAFSSLLNNLKNDSLSLNYLTSDTALADRLALTLDSAQNIAKDSVLTDVSTKKDKSSSNLLNRLSFDLVAAALLTGVTTKATDTDSLTQATVDHKNKNDKNSLGYSVGIVVNYKLNDRFQASAGLVYNVFSEHYNFHYNLKKLDWVLIDSTWQYVERDSINRDIKSKDEYSFISIPLQLSYTFLAKAKLRLSATAGFRSNILLKGVTNLSNQRKSDVVEVRSGFNSISFSYLLALEAEYKLNEHTALLLQPTFVYAASSIHNKASGIVQKLYGVGLTVGWRITF